VRAALEGLPLDVFRAKGTLALADAPNLRFTAQMVGRRVSIQPDHPWADESRGTDLIFIGRPDAITSAELADRFDACMTDSLVLMSRRNLEAAKRSCAAGRSLQATVR
jgi:G3E family GTPase